MREPGSSARIGVSAGVGFFIGLSPAWGYQILLTLVACHRLRLSKTVALLAAHISLPPFIPFIIYTSLVIGRLLLGQDAGRAPTSLELEAHDLPAWILGSLSLGATVGVVRWSVGLPAGPLGEALERERCDLGSLGRLQGPISRRSGGFSLRGAARRRFRDSW